jgi:hypothetical protein
MGIMKNVHRGFGSVGRDRVVVEGSFRPNGATGVVSGSSKGHGWSVARASAGLYTVTFDDFGYQLDSFFCSLREAAKTPTIVQAGDVSSANKTVQIQVLQGAAGNVVELAGHIQIPLGSAIEVESNDVPAMSDTEATAGENAGGTLARDSDPIYQRVNGATDKQLRIEWAAADVQEVCFPGIVMPPDIAANSAIAVKALLESSGTTDAGKTIDCQAVYNPFKGGAYAADTEMGGNLVIPDDTNVNEVSLSLAEADLGGAGVTPHPGVLNLSLVPAAHANDAIHLYGLSLEYTRDSWATDAHKFSAADLTADADNVVNFMAVFKNTRVKNEK